MMQRLANCAILGAHSPNPATRSALSNSAVFDHIIDLDGCTVLGDIGFKAAAGDGKWSGSHDKAPTGLLVRRLHDRGQPEENFWQNATAPLCGLPRILETFPL
jgi:hypothetical protein